ncbi:MAG TPA: c-type cytochrome domain-containing protein [Gemmataceae bacterium]|nr:c-type cytochrome domain-containing protein [Gemmataceae bacterium]
MKYRLFPIALIALLPAVGSAADPKKPPKVTYDEHVLPILRDKCIGCHNQDKKRGGLILSNYTAVMQGGSSGAAVKPGDTENSLLFKAVSHKAEPFMPPNSPRIPDDKLAVIEKWIAGGALENSGSKAIVTGKPKTDIGLTSVIRGKPEGPPPMPPATLQLEPVVRTKEANALTALASNPWSPLVAVGGQKQVLLYNSDTLDLLGVLPFPEGVPHVLKFSRTGALLLAGGGRGGKSGRVVVWSVKTGERVIEVGDESDVVLAADISPDQTQIALGGPSKMIRVYSTKDGKLLHEVKKHTDWVTALEYSPDGVLLATGDRNGGLFVWEAFTAREYFSLRGHTGMITEVSWRNDSNILASSSEDTTVRLWEMENGGQVRSWGAHGGGALAVRYARDGRLVSAGRDRTAKIWDGNGTQQRVFEAFPDLALRAIFTHDDARVVAGDWSGLVRVWTGADGKQVGTLSANPPGAAEQFETAAKELVAAVAKRKEVEAAAKGSREAADKASAELAAAQKAVAESASAIKATTDTVNQAKANVDKANAAVQAGQAEIQAKEVLAKALAEAADKVKASADKAPADKALAAALARARELATQANNDLAGVQKSLTALNAGVKTASDQLDAAQKNLAAVTSQAQAGPKQVEARAAAAKAAAAKAAADQTALDQANAAVTAAAAKVDRWKAALVGAKKDAK